MSLLVGKTVLIIGGTSGVGLAAARRFLAEGTRVAITGTDAGSLKAAQRELGQEGVLPLRADPADVTSQREIARTLAVAFGALDAVFMDVGSWELGAIEHCEKAGSGAAIRMRLDESSSLLQALMTAFANPMWVVLAASMEPRMLHTGIHAATRAALLTLARALSKALSGRGIRVDASALGPIAAALDGGFGAHATVTDVAERSACLPPDARALIVGSELLITRA